MKQRDTYYDNMERLNELIPEKELLDRIDVAKVLGISEKTVSRNFPLKGGKISKASLARCLTVTVQ